MHPSLKKLWIYKISTMKLKKMVQKEYICKIYIIWKLPQKYNSSWMYNGDTKWEE